MSQPEVSVVGTEGYPKASAGSPCPKSHCGVASENFCATNSHHSMKSRERKDEPIY